MINTIIYHSNKLLSIVNNIEVNKKPVFKDNCQQCLACINHCPQKAIRVKGEKNTTRFINQNVILKEIIDANN